jgi:hypothetical protein
MRLAPQEVPMLRSLTRVWPLVLALALLAVPASADVYYVTLTNGTVVQTAHQPQQASWDPNMVLLLTEVGNWIGFPKDQIQGVRVEDPTQGYGVRISDKAIALGRAPNDQPTEEEGKSKTDLFANRYLDIMQRQLQLQESRRSYSVQQFAEPGSSSGIPTSWDGSGSFGFYDGAASAWSNTPTNSDGLNSGIDFGNLTGNGSPPQ